ncbi:MAG: substrate-binding domain-containing protein [Chloroflexota bacterium]
MKKVQPVHAFDQIKLLADPRRMEILRLLMAAPATLTQLARTLGQSPAWVRHHVLALESANLIELAETRLVGKVTEKYYRARASALLLQEVILPKTDRPVMVFSGSHDLALETAAGQLSRHVTLLNLPVGSLDGLVNLRQGLCQVSGAHLLDESGEYNIPFVRHLFPDHEMEIVTLAHRTQGLILDYGNPKAIRGIPDLAREDVRFVNRNPGSGTRLWFDRELKRLGIPPEQVNGYGLEVKTHSEAAALVARGAVDAAIGLQAAARQHNLDFLPLFDERYDLVLPREQEGNLLPLLDHIQTAAFRQETSALTGYNTSHSGEQISCA